MNGLATYQKRVSFFLRSDSLVLGVIRGCTNPKASNYNPNATEDDGSCIILDPNTGDYRPDPNYVRKGLFTSLLFNTSTQTAYNNNWNDDNNGTQYNDAQKPFFAPGDIDPATQTAADPVGKVVEYHYHNTVKTKTNTAHFKITGNTKGRVGSNIDLQTGANKFYVQSVKYEGLTHDVTKKRNAAKQFAGKLFHCAKSTRTGNDYVPYEYLNTKNEVGDIVRSEVVCGPPGNMADQREYWYGQSIFLAGNKDAATGLYTSDWVTGSLDDEVPYLTQWHDTDDNNGEPSRNPVFGFTIEKGYFAAILKWSDLDPNTNAITDFTKEGKLNFRWGKNHRTVGHQGPSSRTDKTVYLPATGGEVQFPYNQWVDIVTHVKWDSRNPPKNASGFGTMTGYGTDWDGILEVWVIYRDETGKRVKRLWIQHYGANCYRDIKVPYWKCGIYLRHFKHGNGAYANSRTLWIDEVRHGNNTSDFDSVVPTALDV